VDDRAFLTDGRPYLTTAQAALYCGFTPTPGVALSKDPQVRGFYGWCLSRGVRQQPGRAVYRRADLDAAIAGQVPETPERAEARTRMLQLARQDVADRRRRARIALTVKRPIKTEGLP
jgi:hypothetical protein